MKAVRLCLPLLALLGCGEDFDPKSLLNKYRVMGIQAEPPDLILTETPGEGVLSTELRAFDFDPTSTDPKLEGARPPTYAWSYCTVSLGSAGEYRCLDGLEEHTIPGEGPVVTFDLAREQMNLQKDLAYLSETYGGTVEGTDPEDLQLPERLPLQIRLRSGDPSIGEVDTVKILTLRLPGDTEADHPNANPTIKSFKIAGFEACAERGDGCFDGTSLGEEVKLEVELEPGSSEACNDSDLEQQKCDPDTGREDLLFSWYTSAGEVEFANTNAETLENTLKLPKSLPEDFAGKAMKVRVFVAVRDGRGGLDVAEGAFTLTEAKGESN